MTRRRTIPAGPHVRPDGTLTQAVWDTLFALANDEVSNVGSRVSGVEESLASVNQRAVQAQATANSAAAGVNTLAGEVATGGGSGLYATVSPPSAFGMELAPSSITSNSVTVTPTGGVAPYTYAWALADGSQMAINSPTAATTTFTSTTAIVAWATYEDTATCTVTDSTGGTPLTTEVAVYVTLYGTSNDLPP